MLVGEFEGLYERVLTDGESSAETARATERSGTPEGDSSRTLTVRTTGTRTCLLSNRDDARSFRRLLRVAFRLGDLRRSWVAYVSVGRTVSEEIE